MIYFIQRASGGPIKIGFARSVPKRVKTLQTGVSEKLMILGVCEGERSYESSLHQLYAEHRGSGEWFEPVPELLKFIKENTVPYIGGAAVPIPRELLVDPRLDIVHAVERSGLSLQDLAAKIAVPYRIVENWSRGNINEEIAAFLLLCREIAFLREKVADWTNMKYGDPGVAESFMDAMVELMAKHNMLDKATAARFVQHREVALKKRTEATAGLLSALN